MNRNKVQSINISNTEKNLTQTSSQDSRGKNFKIIHLDIGNRNFEPSFNSVHWITYSA